MKMKNFGIDEKMCKEKSFQIGEIIDGLTIPNIFCILGTVIVELVLNSRSQGFDISDFFTGWLESLIEKIDKMPDIKDDNTFAN